MIDLIVWAVLTALMIYMALFVTKPLFMRLIWLWFGLGMALLELLELHGGRAPWLVKAALVFIGIVLGVLSYVRDECGQRTRYSIAWSAMRADIARRLGRS